MTLDPDAAVWLLVTLILTGVICWCIAAVLAATFIIRGIRRAASAVSRRRRRNRPAVPPRSDGTDGPEDAATLVLTKFRGGLAAAGLDLRQKDGREAGEQ